MENMKTVELKEIARDLKVKNWWNLKKAELIAAIQNAQNESEDYTIASENADGSLTIIAEVHHEECQNESEDAEEVTNDEDVNETEEAVQNDSDTSEEKPKRKQDLIEYNGKTQNLSQWAKELGIPGQTLYARLHISNWPVEKAFTTPTKKKKKEEA